jgi:uncharacterized protein (DUF2062 family)
MLKIFEVTKKHILKILQLKSSPHSIALGFAIGTFIALLPTFGFGAFIGLFLLLIFENINKISLLSSFVIWNPLILAPIYYLSYKFGILLCGGVVTDKLSFRIQDLLYSFSRTFLIGNFIISLSISVLCYFLIKNILLKINSNKK